MSTEQSVDPELVEQTKQQIRNLVREIAQLSKSELSPAEYYDAILNRLVTALAAVGGAVWTVGEGGRLALEYQINLQETRLAESQEAQMQHGQLLRKVLTTGEGLLAAPRSGSGDEEAGGNPTDFLLVLGPLKNDQETAGIVEIFQRPGSSPTVQRGYLRFLLQMCELAGEYLKTRKLRHFSDRQSLWAQLENFTRVAHRSLNPKSTAYTLANEGRRLIECDRVSVGIVKGRKCKIEAVSGQDTFDPRSNTVSLLGRLATAVVATGDAVWYTGDTSNMAPQVEEAVQAYVDDSHSKAVGVIPLKRPKEEQVEGDHEAPEVIGALIIEQIEDSRPKDGLLQRVEVVSEHSSMALANSLTYHNLFLLPVWETLGKSKWVFQARTLPKTISISIAAVLLLLALFLWPADFNLEGKGSLEPAQKREVFAGVNGIIDEVLVKHGQTVKKDEVLAQMSNNDLDVAFQKTSGDLDATNEQLMSVNRALSGESRLKPVDEKKMEGQRLELQAQVTSLKKQLDLLNKKQQQLNVTSPIDGQMVTWQVRELLIHRPVQQGQVLMTVANPDGDWELEIHMPENRMGHVAAARNQLSKDREVTYILATNPGKTLYGKVKEVHEVANVRGEEGNTVLVKVAINRNDIDDNERRPGATVTAKVNCGRASIGYVWFHDLIAWFQTKILFRL